MKIAMIAAALALSAAPLEAEMISKTSPHSVSDTIDKLIAAVEGAGAKVFAKVDHAAGAQSVDQELSPNMMVMFGNPKLGTPAMQAAPSAGLDLPLRVAVFENADGVVTLVYHDPMDLAAVHGIPSDAQVVGAMTGAMGKLTDAAIAP